ncbi:hypothetical protein DL764_008423 [Monosporascus ibericus]|uniref:Uncharacterized protein n=1 Tax=Monosporascus ibericus TaxID=155417 RepID=A0A4Q4T0J2_9PEZI|nr:hypothetical protein DL764_008423 [Monosporascus ibericus]
MASSSTTNAPSRPTSQAVSSSSLHQPRSKKAMDIRIHELTDDEVRELTGLLSRRPSFGIGRPSKRWFEHQAKLMSRLPAAIMRPNNPLKRLVVKYGDAIGFDRPLFEYPPAVLCPTHYELHPRVMRRLFVIVLDEVTRHADRLRRWPGGRRDPQFAAFLDRIDGLGALWMEPRLYIETFHAPPADRRMVKVESFCEACTLAVLGANARTLGDIRAVIIDRAERIRDRKERRWREDEARRKDRRRRKEEGRGKKRTEREDEQRMLEHANRDPEREIWRRTGKAKNADTEQYQMHLDEVEAKHRLERERRRSASPRRESKCYSHQARRESRRPHHHRSSRDEDESGSRDREPPKFRDPRLLRIVDIWIDHLGAERADKARAMSGDALAMLRYYRPEIAAAAPRQRPVSYREVRLGNTGTGAKPVLKEVARSGRDAKHAHRSRYGLPVANAAPAPVEAAEQRQAAEWYRDADDARSVYKPDSLAGGFSDIGLPGMPPPSPGGGYARPDNPEPPRSGQLSRNGSPTRSFIQHFEREMQVDGGAGSQRDPYDDEDDDEDEAYEEAYARGRGKELDYEQEERSHEKVAAWAVNAWAHSHRDLPRAELERGARSVIDGIHPAFRPSPSRADSFARRSAVPPPLFVGKDKGKGKDRDTDKDRDNDDRKDKRHRHSRRESTLRSRTDAGAEKAGGVPCSESAVWTDATVHTDWRDHSHHDLANAPPVPRVPSRYNNRNDGNDGDKTPTQQSPPGAPVVGLVAGIDPNQSTISFSAYADPLGDRHVSSSSTPRHPAQQPPHSARAGQVQVQGQTTPTSASASAKHQNPAPSWSPAKKPSRKYCFPDSDVGSAVRDADRWYLEKNAGFMRGVRPEENPFLSSQSPSTSPTAAAKGEGGRTTRDGTGTTDNRNPELPLRDPGENDDPWAAYEKASTSHPSRAASSRTSRGSRAASKSTAPTSIDAGGGGDGRAPTPRVATAEDEREWRRGWGVEDEDDFILPDDSASNVHWARRASGDDVTRLGDFVGR